MIRTFRHRGLKEIFETGKSRLIRPDTRDRVATRLDVLDAARTIAGVNAPGFDLHEFKGDRAGEWAIKVNKNQRITFKFKNGDAFDVHLEDYH